MSKGTLAFTNKSDSVTGGGTSFKTDLNTGDFVVVNIGGTAYTLTVKSITSDTQLTLISKYSGPTADNVAWYAVPREAQSLVTAALVTQSTEALRGLNLDKTNWQQIFSAEESATIVLPDLTSITGPSWRYILESRPSLSDVKKLIDACFPIGIRLDWPSLTLPDNPSLGIKFLRLNSSSFDTKLYPKLAEVYPSGKLPDMRASVPRGYDDGRGIDQGRALLSEQADAIQNITGSFGGIANSVNRSYPIGLDRATGAFSFPGGGARDVGSIASSQIAVSGLSSIALFDASLVVRTADETRMRNMAWNMIVRAS